MITTQIIIKQDFLIKISKKLTKCKINSIIKNFILLTIKIFAKNLTEKNKL